jgi:hypothetical protein
MTKYYITDADRASARQLTDEIKAAADNLWELLTEAWNAKAYASLGYKSWRAYIEAEFDFSRQYSYRLINQGQVIKQLREAAKVSPVGDDSDSEVLPGGNNVIVVSEREARDIASVIDVVAHDVREQVDAGVPAQDAVRSAVESHRQAPVIRSRFDDDGVHVQLPDRREERQDGGRFITAVSTIVGMQTVEIDTLLDVSNPYLLDIWNAEIEAAIRALQNIEGQLRAAREHHAAIAANGGAP